MTVRPTASHHIPVGLESPVQQLFIFRRRSKQLTLLGHAWVQAEGKMLLSSSDTART